ncbi:hypothetical protein [Variovorax sp. OV329]|uniref:hypothetical protein n=1 Tax=Variovorax sp. OV329 TaxID=1882825 RepID=UPI0008EE673E|nr:hypothetical protein [Variovorax sp. OV329]SFN03679.1 hypothetical protein SAMN05444747_113131 [Variovorax sp. OV329]
MEGCTSKLLQSVRTLSGLIALTAVPWGWSIASNPITKAAVYTGPITLWMAVSIALWAVLSLACFACVLGVHFRHPNERSQAWSAALAGQCAFMLLIAGCGTVIEHSLEGSLSLHWSDLFVVLLPACLLAISLPKLKA